MERGVNYNGDLPLHPYSPVLLYIFVLLLSCFLSASCHFEGSAVHLCGMQLLKPW